MKRRLLALMSWSLVLVLAACSLPGGAAVTPMPDINTLETVAAQTAIAIMVETQLAQSTPLPSLTPPAADTPQFTATASLTPTPLFTPTPAVPMMSVSVDTNCRSGPGKVYDLNGGLMVNETVKILARDPSGEYYYIENPDAPGSFCWVWGGYATIAGDTSQLPVYTPPPTPTPIPDFTLNYVEMDVCTGWYLRFQLQNTGQVAFESLTITIKDRNNNLKATDSSETFDNWDGCLQSSAFNTFVSGQKLMVVTPLLSKDPSGHKVEVTFTLCSQDNMKGTCITKSILVKP